MTLNLASRRPVKLVLPADLALDPEVIYGGVIANNYSYVDAVVPSGTVGSRNSKIIFNMPQEVLSMQDSWLEFKITTSVGNTAGPPVCSFVPDIRSIFSRMVLQFGSKTILDIDGFGILNYMFSQKLDPQIQNYNNSVLVASDSAIGNRQIYFADPTKTYCCRLNLVEGMQSLFDRIMPFNLVGSQMQLQLYLSDPAAVISSSIAITGTVQPSYILNECQLHYISSVPSQALINSWNENLSSSLTFSYRTFEFQQQTNVAVSGISNLNLVLTFKKANFLGLFITFQNPANQFNYQSDNKIQQFINPNMNLLRLKIGSVFYPTDQQTNFADLFTRFLSATGTDVESPVAAAANWGYNSTPPALASFIACCPVAKHPNSINQNNSRTVVEGIDTSIATSVVLECGFATPLPTTYIMNIYAYYGATITLNANGSISLYT
jgi:hypothetical protein